MNPDRDVVETGAPCLSVTGLSVRYGAFAALDGLDFEAMAGEVLGLIGPNGAGKTTLVKSICGRINPSAGTISIAGDAIRPKAVKPGLVGLVPQEIGLYPFLTAAENLDIFARIHGFERSARAEAVATALAAVDMTPHADKKVSELSGGMKRRINFAAAILNRPKLLILDEPTAGVDVAARDTIHKLARQLAGDGMGIILVTHELEQAELICDRVLILARGHKRHLAAPDDLLEEIFAGQQLVTLRLRRYPEDFLKQKLTLHGFAVSDSETTWAGLISGDHNKLVETATQDIISTGNVIQEISVSRPGLETLVHQIVAETPTNEMETTS